MKKIIIIFGLILVGLAAYLVLGRKVPAPAGVTLSLVDGTYCYYRGHDATATEPYAIEEMIRLDISGANVTGTKNGRQTGPDMSNGYQGTLSGTRSGNDMTLVYSYTVEGSQNKEQELYTWSFSELTKHGYTFIERNGMLVPDASAPATTIVYSQTFCG